MNTLLIGPRASGKTSLGRRLALRRGCRFVDLDDLALARFAEKSVRDVWFAHGEKAWRDAEVGSLREALAQDDQVIALGGGTPMIDAARVMILEARRAGSAYVVYLQCAPEVLEDRLRDLTGDRPSLTGADVVAEVRAVLAVREPTYLAVCDQVLEAGCDDAETLVDRLL